MVLQRPLRLLLMIKYQSLRVDRHLIPAPLNFGGEFLWLAQPTTLASMIELLNCLMAAQLRYQTVLPFN